MENDRLFQLRVSEKFFAALDRWRSKQKPIPSRAEAVRVLVALGAAKSVSG